MQRRAFTLVELLVVMAIITLLAGMLFTLVGYGKSSADKTKEDSTLRIVHDGVVRYKELFNVYPQTVANALTENDLGTKLCNTGLDVTNKKADILRQDLPTSQQRADGALVDTLNATPYIFVSTRPGVATLRTAIAIPDEGLLTDASSILTQAYSGYDKGFELWSAGQDGLFEDLRNDPANDDNRTVTVPFGNQRY